MNPDRRALHAYLSIKSHDTILNFSESNGVSLTGLIEALAEELSEDITRAKDDVTKVRQSWVLAGRKIDAARRRRG